MSKKKLLTWAKAAGVRAVKTMAQTAAALIPMGITIQEVSWGAVVGTALLAGVCSLLTSITGLPEIKEKGSTWTKAAGIRAIKTVAQTAASLIPMGISIQEVSWVAVAGTALLAGVCSLLTSITGLPEIKE